MHVSKNALLIGLATVALTSCDAPAAENVAQAPQAPARPKSAIMIRSMSGAPREKAFLVAPKRDVPFDQLAAGVRETGNRCEVVTAFNQLEQDDHVIDVYKLDCGKRSYQVTVLADSTHIKRWTGDIFGE
jgi:hypothetical protein